MSKLISSTLEQVCLHEKGAIISGPFGSNISSKFFVESGIPVIRGNNLSLNYDKFFDNHFVFVTPEKADELNCYAYRNDLIFTAAGTIGQVGVIPENSRYTKYVISNKQIRARIDTKKIDLLYAYYWFSSPWIRAFLIRNNKVSTVPLLTLSEIKDLPIVFPESIDEQKAIISVIDNITKKIETNKKINDYLEEMAKTIYNYWFVQFDFPDENGNPYKSSGGKMDFIKNFGLAPSNWKIGNLYDIAEFINGLACQKYRPTENEASLPVIKIKEMHDGISSDTERVKSSIPENNIVRTGDILFSWSASLEVQRWTGITGGLNQHIFKVIPKEKYSSSYVYHQLKSYVIKFIQMAEARKTTMGHITRDHLKQSVIILPPENIIRDFSNQVDNIHAEICRINKECQKLSQLRDWILPMLMNSQATIED
jgi:type I restriction enzyme S subunit